jgi:hypothetical protein
MENQNSAENTTVTASDGSHRVLDRIFLTAATDQHQVGGQSKGPPLLEAPDDGVRHGLTGLFLDDSEHLVELLAFRLAGGPAG